VDEGLIIRVQAHVSHCKCVYLNQPHSLMFESHLNAIIYQMSMATHSLLGLDVAAEIAAAHELHHDVDPLGRLDRLEEAYDLHTRIQIHKCIAIQPSMHRTYTYVGTHACMYLYACMGDRYVCDMDALGRLDRL
jgi:nitrous oxide reductase